MREREREYVRLLSAEFDYEVAREAGSLSWGYIYIFYEVGSCFSGREYIFMRSNKNIYTLYLIYNSEVEFIFL